MATHTCSVQVKMAVLQCGGREAPGSVSKHYKDTSESSIDQLSWLWCWSACRRQLCSLIDGGLIDGGLIDGGLVDGSLIDGSFIDSGLTDGTQSN